VPIFCHQSELFPQTETFHFYVPKAPNHETSGTLKTNTDVSGSERSRSDSVT